ncbi:hypothetical protein [Pseudonocardia sp. GCM10023141]|uniref:hypothetical protein n=1 Tax=Pseudonocardia sp. GCM10023141 TaxID=3252653 RepID=UPI0036131AA5
MNDQTAGSGGGMPSPDMVEQIRSLLGRLAELPGQVTGGLGQAAGGLPGITRPGALSAAQMSSLTSAITAQRSTIAALQAQLIAFDEQLAVLEQLVDPLSKLAGTWASVERGILGGGHGAPGQ